ncbi:MAG: 50S ribosomal protein L10, partial [Clostridiales bacterium]|nr:50S ribosomal protein L10 [Clostridiales bacterium]
MSEHNIDQRKAYVADVVEKINNSSSVVLVDYRGINVAQDTAMRKALRDAGVVYHVIKNSALSRAF